MKLKRELSKLIFVDRIDAIVDHKMIVIRISRSLSGRIFSWTTFDIRRVNGCFDRSSRLMTWHSGQHYTLWFDSNSNLENVKNATLANCRNIDWCHKKKTCLQLYARPRRKCQSNIAWWHDGKIRLLAKRCGCRYSMFFLLFSSPLAMKSIRSIQS